MTSARHRRRREVAADVLDWDLGETQGTVAVQMPAQQVAIDLLNQTRPLAVSSANLTGQPSRQDCDAAQAMLGEAVTVYPDASLHPGGAVPWSIVDVTGIVPLLLRAGVISDGQLRKAVPDRCQER